MSSLKCYSSLFTPDQIQMLRVRHIKSVLDFIQETPENINKITKLHFKDILEMKEKLVLFNRGNVCSGLQLYNKEINNQKTFPSGISAIEEVVGEFELGASYELCGLSGSGKTQICLAIAAHAASIGHKVHYIDTKNEFNASKVYKIIHLKQMSEEVAINCLNKIVVTKVSDFYQLISFLHKLRILFTSERCPLVVIDCISTLYFLEIGQDDNVGLGLLNHVASLIKYITTEFHITLILTNLATNYSMNTEKALQGKKIKPSLGNYWLHVCDVRITTRKLTNSDTILLEKDNHSICLDLNGL